MAAHPFADVHDWLDRHVAPGRPVALACSGGSDSHALLLIASDWARARGRTLLVLTVDHGLRTQSGGEADAVAQRARALGHEARILRWEGDKPSSGLQAAAREARHRLLADAARTAGACDLLLAHTLDDQAETVWMRLASGGGRRGCSGMAPIAPSPVWPDGREVRILRPLLDIRREALREGLRARGESWIDDPSNLADRFMRVRVRRRLAALRQAGFDDARLVRMAGDIRAILAVERRAAARLAGRAVRFFDWGGVRLEPAVFAAAASVVRRAVIESACLAVSGQARLPSAAAVDRIEAGLLAQRRCTGGGVLLAPWRGAMWMVRDPGAVTGRVDRPDMPVLQGELDEAVWDGRVLVSGLPDGWTAGPLGRSYDGLDDRALLDAVPGFARPGLMALRCDRGVVAVAGLWPCGGAAVQGTRCAVRPLQLHRFCTRLLPAVPAVWFDRK